MDDFEPMDIEDRIGGLIGDDLSVSAQPEPAPADAVEPPKAEADAPDAKADEVADQQADEPKYKVKVNGQELEVP
ncbi:MAG: hypothetical protein ABFD96_22150, partial [Armatimonadia bacterium]